MNDHTRHPDATPRPCRLTLITLCLAVLAAQADIAIVNLAARPIGDQFGAPVDALQWVVDSYNLAYAALLLSGGLLADLYGRRRFFMAGAALFTAASLLCALAPSIPVLICARALSGLGAALLIPASLAIIRVVWHDPGARGRALGFWAACNGLAMAIGPTLGGLLIPQFGWRSVFLVVIPLGLAAFVLAPFALPESSDPQNRDFDAPAQGLGALALGSLAFAAIQSHHAIGPALAALAIALAALALFIKVEATRGSAALVPLDMFKGRAFRGAFVAMTGMTFGGYGMLFLLPLAWQSSGRLDAPAAGLALVPMALAFVFVSPCSGAVVRHFGVRTATAGGVATMGSGLLVIAASASWPTILPTEFGLTLTGIGLGLAAGPLAGIAVGTITAARSGTASALINVARITGATLGVAALGAVYALAEGGVAGLRLSMLAGGLVQLASAAAAWRMTGGRENGNGIPRSPASTSIET